MTSTGDNQVFRFLDIPAELRCMVYESIDTTTVRRVLQQTEAGMATRGKDRWTGSPDGADHGSSITFIRSALLVGVLSICRLVNQEATPIIARRLATLQQLPIRYLVDWASARALSSLYNPLRDCLGPELPLHLHRLVGAEAKGSVGSTLEAFMSKCVTFLKATLSGQNNGIPNFQITIDHDCELVYGQELFTSLVQLMNLTQDFPCHLEVVYKTSLPRMTISSPSGRTLTGRGPQFESSLIRQVKESVLEDVDEAGNTILEVDLKALGEEAFQTHLEGLNLY
jgi:hypothetical protein